MTYDPEAIRELGRRFWSVWLGAAVVAMLGVFLAAVGFAPENALIVALTGVLAVFYLAVGAVSMTLDRHLDATGEAVAATGFVVWAGAAAVGFPDGSFWYGVAIVFVGGVVGLWADHGDRVRAAVGV